MGVFMARPESNTCQRAVSSMRPRIEHQNQAQGIAMCQLRCTAQKTKVFISKSDKVETKVAAQRPKQG